MVDIGTMTIHRGLATKKQGTTTIQAIVEKLGFHFPNTDEIRHGGVFNLSTTDLSKYAQLYCAKYVKVPLLIFTEYWK